MGKINLQSGIILFFCFLGASSALHSQTILRDTVVMGFEYQNDVFYSLKNPKNKTTVSNTNYHLAFSNMFVGQNDRFYTIWINDNNTEVFVNPSQKVKDWNNFESRNYTNWRKLQNTDSSWGKGGFSTGVEKHPRYTWAVYANNGEFVGDSLYLISIKGQNQTATQLYKLRIVKRQSSSGDRDWTINYGKADNSWDTTIILQDLAKSQGNFMYFDMLNNQEVVREPDTKEWDLLFTPYMDYQEVEEFYYPVKGVLQNYKIRTKVMEHLKLKDVTFMDWADTSKYSKKINSIGYQWKEYNIDSMRYTMADSNVYFVSKTLDNGMEEVYALQFVSFGGAKTGEIVFDVMNMGFITSVEKTTPINNVKCYPNPTENSINVNIDKKGSFTIFNILGSKMLTGVLSKGNNPIDISTFDKGIYFLEIYAANKTYKTIKVLKH